MARPITWNDVAAPDFRSSLVASQAAGNTIANSLQGLGQAATQFRDDTRADATREVVAEIMSSADPLAAARAAPKGWQVDPLAAQEAGFKGDQRIKANIAADAALNASRTSTAAAQAVLDDRVALRQGEDMAIPYHDDIFSGKAINIDRKDPRYATAAGKAFLDRIDGWQKEFADNKFRNDTLSFQKAKLKADGDEADFAKRLRDAKGEAYAIGGHEGQGDDTGAVVTRMEGVAERHNLPPNMVELLVPEHQRGAARFVPSKESLYEKSPVISFDVKDKNGVPLKQEDGTPFRQTNSYSYKDFSNALSVTENAAKQEQMIAANTFDQLNNTSALLAKSTYEGLTEEDAAEKLGKTMGISTTNARERMDLMQRKAPEGVVFTVAQKAEAARATGGDLIGKLVKDNWSDTDAARGLREQYAALQKRGGAKKLAIDSAEFYAKLPEIEAKFANTRTRFNAAVNSGDKVPDDIAAMLIKQNQVKRDDLERQIEESAAASKVLDRAVAKEKTREEVKKIVNNARRTEHILP